MEDKGMKITVLGAALIVAAFIAAILLLRHFPPAPNQSSRAEGIAPCAEESH